MFKTRLIKNGFSFVTYPVHVWACNLSRNNINMKLLKNN